VGRCLARCPFRAPTADVARAPSDVPSRAEADLLRAFQQVRLATKSTGAVIAGRLCEERSDDAIHFPLRGEMDALRSLSSGGHSPNPLARNDEKGSHSRPYITASKT
jgi:hypothetical protein